MRQHRPLIIVLLAISFCVMGCRSTPVPYSFAGNGDKNTATISFPRNDRITGKVTLINFDDKKLPKAETFTRWEPITFPAGKKFQLRLLTEYDVSSLASVSPWTALIMPILIMQTFSEYINFYCPPLEAGKNYRLSFRAGFATIGRKLVLMDTQTGRTVYEQKY